MIHRIQARTIELTAKHRPPGYAAAVFAAGTRVGDWIELPDAAYAKLRQRFNPDGKLPAVVAKRAKPSAWGPALWGRIHLYAATWNGDRQAAAEMIAAVFRLLPCGSCKEHFRKLLKTHPADLSSSDTFFASTVTWHDLTNAMLGKPVIGLQAARKLWQRAVAERSASLPAGRPLIAATDRLRREPAAPRLHSHRRQ